jgi:hypothetical protein
MHIYASAKYCYYMLTVRSVGFGRVRAQTLRFLFYERVASV